MDRKDVIAQLAAAGCIAPADEADELISAAPDDEGLRGLLAQRARGEPVAWLTGRIRFCGAELSIDPGVYVPRWQTEPLARAAAELLPERGVAVDLCTGAGAIAVTLARAVPSARVFATELDPVAAACARRNGVDVFEGSLDEPLPAELRGQVDVMTAVVPYVPTESLSLLPCDVLAYEPREALDGGPGGTGLLFEVVRRSVRWLRPGGWLLLELGGDQAATTAALLGELGFSEVEVTTDEEGDPRAIRGML